MSEEEKPSEVKEVKEQELSTGLIIAGAYADKLRRTLFAQLKDLVKANKEFAKEVARASGEINRLLYIIIVEKLKADKGDVVRVRVKYSVENWKVKWHYDTLRLEYFKRVPDEEVMKVVQETIKEKLPEIQALYATPPAEAAPPEEKEKVEEVKPTAPEAAPAAPTPPTPAPTAPPTPPTPAPAPAPAVAKPEEKVEEVKAEITLSDIVKEAAPIGETMEGGVVFEIKNAKGENIGIASLEARGDVYVAEAIILPKPGEAYRVYVKLSRSIDEYKEDPGKLIEELVKATPVKITAEEAKKILQAKMESLV